MWKSQVLNGNVVIETQFFDGDLLVSTSKVKTNVTRRPFLMRLFSGSSLLCVELRKGLDPKFVKIFVHCVQNHFAKNSWNILGLRRKSSYCAKYIAVSCFAQIFMCNILCVHSDSYIIEELQNKPTIIILCLIFKKKSSLKFQKYSLSNKRGWETIWTVTRSCWRWRSMLGWKMSSGNEF